MQEINVSRTGDPVHAGDKTLMRETPVQRGRVNRYASVVLVKEPRFASNFTQKFDEHCL